METKEAIKVLEGLLFICGDEGVPIQDASRALELEPNEVRDLFETLAKNYQYEERGLQIKEIGERFQMMTLPEHANYFKTFVEVPEKGTLSQAALEALAIVAYQQPITRIEVEDIRGVKSEKAIQTLVAKGLIRESGRAEGTGRAILYGTTDRFLNHFGLSSIEDLPPLPDKEKEKEEEREADLFFDSLDVSFFADNMENH